MSSPDVSHPTPYAPNCSIPYAQIPQNSPIPNCIIPFFEPGGLPPTPPLARTGQPGRIVSPRCETAGRIVGVHLLQRIYVRLTTYGCC